MPAIVGVLTSHSLDPKLPPADTGCMSSLLLGTLSVPASMNRYDVKLNELAWMVIMPLAMS